MLGSHWIADATDCSTDRLTAASIAHALVVLPERLGLVRVGDPQVFEHCAGGAEPPTIAGIVLIAESHVSFHVFPEARALHADVFSCRELDYRLAREFVVEHFGAVHVEDRVYPRGESGSAALQAVRRLR